jgi:hypothetical protein
MNCINCGRSLRNASATGMGPKCARKKRKPDGPVYVYERDLLSQGFDLDRMCRDAQRSVDAWIARRASEIQRQLQGAEA